MNNVYIALGSNLGNREQNIRTALDKINDRIGEIKSCSSVYMTKPVGFVSENNFANAACHVETALLPLDVLRITQEIEIEMGRLAKSHNKQYSDRIIDIDILMYNNNIVDTPTLILPHPQMHERSFVLDPLSEIAGDLYHPTLNKTIEELRIILSESTNS